MDFIIQRRLLDCISYVESNWAVIVNNEWGGIWKEDAGTHAKFCSTISLEVLRKLTK
jgi:hypothetical protein